MLKTVRRLLAGLVVASVSVVGVGAAAHAAPDSVVSFQDPKLKACVEKSLNLPAGTAITESQMSSMIRLSCDYSGIADIEPLKFASGLERVFLDGNEITDVSWLAGLSRLQIVSIQGNKISDISPLVGISGIHDLFVGSNPLSSIEPLRQMTSVVQLAIQETGTSNLAPIANLSNLKMLSMGQNPISDISLLSGFDLEALYMSNTQVKDLDPIKGMKNLKYFAAEETKVVSVAPLSGLTSLDQLLLDGNHISDISPLSGLTELSRVSFAGNDISDISPMAGLTKLTQLDIRSNKVTDMSSFAGRSISWFPADGQRVDERAVTVGQSVALPSIVTKDGSDVVFTITSGEGTISGSTVTWTAPGEGVVSWASAETMFAGEIPFAISAPVPPAETTAPGLSGVLANGKVKAAYSAALKVTGTPVPKLEITKGALPNGLKMDTAGKITGTPLKAGSFTFTVTASNGTKPDAVKQFTIKVTEAVTDPKPPVVTGKCMEPRKVPVFADTPLSHKFYKEIDWMECMKYSTGWKQSAGKPVYKPADNLQRQAMAAFIFRMEADKNYQAPKVSPFADVQPGDKFYREIAWMWDQKLSTGYQEAGGKPTYRPTDSLSREAMAAFIYRLEASKDAKVKSYQAPKASMLADMKPGAKFYKEISWMYDSKLSTGNTVGNTKEYWPKADLSRQAMAAFIYRLVTDYRVNK